jgi:glycosyltransferase involved in cell wall biosynthesis
MSKVRWIDTDGPDEPKPVAFLKQTPPLPAGHEPLRLLFLNHNVVRAGGTFFRAFDAARYLVRRGHSVTLLSISTRSRWHIEREVNEGVEIIHTPDLFWGIGRSGWDPWDTVVRMKLAAAGDWDIVHAWDCRPAVIFPALAATHFGRSHQTKLLIDWCDWWGRGGTQMERGGSWVRYVYNFVETFFEEAFRRYADGTTVISTPLFDRAVRLGLRATNIRIIPQGCDAVVPDPIGRTVAREALGLNGDAPIFITVGVLNTSDAALLFETVPLVRKYAPDAKFFIIGRNRARVPDALSKDAVSDLGFVSDETLSYYFAAADAMVVPLADTVSSRARWPSKVNLSLTRGVPVVVTRVGDLPRILENEGAAFVARPDPDSLAAAIIDAVRERTILGDINAAAKRVATEMLRWDAIIDDLEAYYYEVLDKPQAHVTA